MRWLDDHLVDLLLKPRSVRLGGATERTAKWHCSWRVSTEVGLLRVRWRSAVDVLIGVVGAETSVDVGSRDDRRRGGVDSPLLEQRLLSVGALSMPG